MSKKLFALALSAMLVLSLLAGCGGNKHPPAKPGVFHMRAKPFVPR